MFEAINPNKEHKQAVEAEKRAMDFQREQNTFKTAATEDTTELQNQQGRPDLIKWQQDLKSEIVELKLKLLGYELTNEGWVQKHKPLCNDLFVNQIIDPMFTAYMSRGFINTNLDEHQLLMRLKKTCNNLSKTLISKYEKYEIDFEDFDDIDTAVKNILVPAAFRALKGWTKKTDSTIFKRLETSQENGKDDDKKSGLFGFK
jgi:hypothetical protein